MIYADNAATTQLDPEAFEAMKPFLLENYGNASQPYAFGQRSKKAVEEARRTIASCIGALPEEIFFTSGGTESDNWVIKNAPEGIIVTSQIEHHAILNSCKSEEKAGRKILYLPVDSSGIVDPRLLHHLDGKKVSLVSVMMANNEVGSIQKVSELVDKTHELGALFHTDAVQAVGHIPIDVSKSHIDFLSASAHKFNGPKGAGFLFIRKGIPMKEFISGGAQESRLRAGTENTAGIVGMAVALQRNIAEMNDNAIRLKNYEDLFLSVLSEAKIDFIRNGENTVPGNISISIKGQEGESLLHLLDLGGICISTGSACNSVNTEISHVLHAMGVPERYVKGTIRISFGKYNTKEEVVKVAEQIAYASRIGGK